MNNSRNYPIIAVLRDVIARLRELEDKASERDKELLEGLKKLMAKYVSGIEITGSGNCQSCFAPIEFNLAEIVRKFPGESSYRAGSPVKCCECGATNVVLATTWLSTDKDGGCTKRISTRVCLRYPH